MTISPEKHALLILGIDHSGASALAGFFNMLGYHLPKTIMAKKKSDEGPVWVSDKLFLLNETIFSKLNNRKLSWGPLNSDELGSGTRKKIVEEVATKLRSEYPDKVDIVITEPGISRISDLYFEAFVENNWSHQVIIPVRNPIEVAHLLFKSHGLSDGESSMLWLRYLIDAEFQTRNTKRYFTIYENLVSNPVETLTQLSDNMSLKPQNSVEDIAQELKRYNKTHNQESSYSPEDLMLNPVMRGWVSEVYMAMRMLATDPTHSKSIAVLDKIRVEIGNATPLILHMTDSMLEEKSEIETYLKKSEDERDVYFESLNQLQDRLNRLQTNLKQASDNNDHYKRENEQLTKKLTASEKITNKLQTDLKTKDTSLKKSLDNNKQLKDQIKTEQMQLKKENEQLIKKLTASEKITKKLQADLKTKDTSLKKSLDNNKHLKGQFEQSSKRYEASETMSQKLKKDIKNITNNNVHLKRVIEQTSKQADDAKADFEKSKDQLINEKTELSNTIHKLSKDVSRLQRELEEEKQTILKPIVRRFGGGADR